MKKTNAVWISLAFLYAICLCGESRAQDYKFERTIGHPPTIGEPQGLAVDKAGTMYVADRINGRVIKVTADGRMETNLFKTRGELTRPSAVALDARGNLLVVDETQPVVQRLTRTGAVAQSFKATATATLEQGKAEQSKLGGIAVDAQGNTYVSDQSNNSIQKFDAQGKLIASWGKKGSEPGSFLGPRGLAVGPQGRLYVADEFNNRIQSFDANGKLQSVSGAQQLGTTLSGGLGPMSVAVDSKGNIWVAAHTNFSVYKLDPSFGILVRLETFGNRNGELAGPVAVAVDAADNVYVLDRSRRIQKFSSDGNFLSKFAFPPAKLGELSAPIGVITDRDGNLYVADDANFRIQKFDKSGRPLLSFGTFGHGNGEFNGVESLALDRAGNIYAVDSFNHRIQKFDSNGKFLAKFGSLGSRDGEFLRTKVVAIDLARDLVYVNDWHNARVQKFDLDGNFKGSFGNTGPPEQRVLGPTGLAIDEGGNVYVSSWFNNAILKFDANGRYVTSIGKQGTEDGQLKGPARLAMDRDGNLVAADWGNNRVQIFTTQGRFVAKFGSLGSAEGRFNQPVGVAVDANGNLFVSDVSNARVQVFSKSRTSRTSPRTDGTEVARTYVHVAMYDVAAGAAQLFEAALLSTRDATRASRSFINERVLRNVDPLALQYATYSKFSDPGEADRFFQQRWSKVRQFCRREPEVHMTELIHSYFPAGTTDHATGMEYGQEDSGQIAHLGFFIPLPHYRQQFDDVLHETKLLTRAKTPTGYMGEDVLLELDLIPPQAQTPYSPRPAEASRMSINYGEYKTMENAEDSYISRQQQRDQKLVTMERLFFSSLQVPTRFYIFQVVGNYSRLDIANGNSKKSAGGNR